MNNEIIIYFNVFEYATFINEVKPILEKHGIQINYLNKNMAKIKYFNFPIVQDNDKKVYTLLHFIQYKFPKMLIKHKTVNNGIIKYKTIQERT